MIKIFQHVFSHDKKILTLCILATLIEVTCALFIPYIMINIFATGILNHDQNYILYSGIVTCTLAISAMIFGSINAHFSSVLSARVGKNIRQKLFSKSMFFSEDIIDQLTIASLSTRLNNDVTAIQVALLQCLRSVVYVLITIILSIIFIMFIKPVFSLIIICGIVLFSFILTCIFHFAIPQFGNIQTASDSLNRTTQENIIAQRIVKSLVMHDYEEKKFSKINKNLEHYTKRAMSWMLLIMPLTTLIMNGSTTTLLFLGGQQTVNVGELNALLAYTTQAFGSLMLLALMTAQLGKASVSIKRVREVLEIPCDKQYYSADKQFFHFNNKIEFHDVSFKYNMQDRSLLSQISLQINHGDLFAIIGSTGEGKSTLAKLIPRIYQVTSGYISIDGISIEDISLRTLRKEIAFCPQHSTLFSGTIIDNLTCGNPSITKKMIDEVCKIVQAYDFINNFTNGYYTRIEQGGANLSGGQRHRLCIARALLKNSSILILDDSTSALDKITEKKVLKNIQTAFKHLTIILISQKISTVQFADKILVLNNGHISGLNTHAKLLNSNRIYQEIYESQKGDI